MPSLAHLDSCIAGTVPFVLFLQLSLQPFPFSYEQQILFFAEAMHNQLMHLIFPPVFRNTWRESESESWTLNTRD